MITELLRCARKLIVAAACLSLLDAVVGGVSRLAFEHQKSGKWHRIHRAMESAEKELFVFGSSHAAQHYVPDVLAAETGLSSYNAGVLGQQVLFHSVLESVILRRVRPAVIILDVDPGTLFANPDTYARLADLKPFYHRHPEVIGPALELRSRWEPLFLRSRLYQYNSTIVHVLRYWLAPQPDLDGYRPDHASMRPLTPEQEHAEIVKSRASADGRAIDPVMVRALEQFAAEGAAKGARVFFCVSPGALPYDLASNRSFREAESVARRAGVPFFNFRNDQDFVGRYELFADLGHLNDEGARRYSKLVAEAIKRQLDGTGSPPGMAAASR